MWREDTTSYYLALTNGKDRLILELKHFEHSNISFQLNEKLIKQH